MTVAAKTVTDHLHDALTALENDMPAPSEMVRAREAIEEALRLIDLAQCEAHAAIDKF